jgi:16S rRNA (cytosine967-C5)-methyltransferase
LVYSVCSLEPEEGEDRLAEFLTANRGWRVDHPADLPHFARPDSRGAVRILPGLLEEHGGLDGFFVARLVRGRD